MSPADRPAPRPPDAMAPGTAFGRYTIVRLLGRGGMGVVYEAEHVDLRKRVALKTLLAAPGDDPVVAERFVREGRTASQVRHPHIVEVFDAGVQGGVPFLVMEYLVGESLGAMLEREGAIAPERVVAMLLPVAAAIATAHDGGVIHRDIKPDNIFLARERKTDVVPKVLDFGISKASTGAEDLKLTSTGAMIGTPVYMSPEQARGETSVDARSDQYALGVVLYECVTGRPPFDAPNFLALLHAIIAGRYPPPRALVPALPEALERVIARALALDPAARFPSVLALGRALLAFADPVTRAHWQREFDAAVADAPSASVARSLESTVRDTLVSASDARPTTLARTGREIDAPSRHAGARRRGLFAALAATTALVATVLFVRLGFEHDFARPGSATPVPPATRPIAPPTVRPAPEPAPAVVASAADAAVAPTVEVLRPAEHAAAIAPEPRHARSARHDAGVATVTATAGHGSPPANPAPRLPGIHAATSYESY